MWTGLHRDACCGFKEEKWKKKRRKLISLSPCLCPINTLYLVSLICTPESKVSLRARASLGHEWELPGVPAGCQSQQNVLCLKSQNKRYACACVYFRASRRLHLGAQWLSLRGASLRAAQKPQHEPDSAFSVAEWLSGAQVNKSGPTCEVAHSRQVSSPRSKFQH